MQEDSTTLEEIVFGNIQDFDRKRHIEAVVEALMAN